VTGTRALEIAGRLGDLRLRILATSYLEQAHYWRGDYKGSMELLADRDPEEARTLLDPVLERMMEAVRRYEGTVNQVMGDGIIALFGAPLAHEDHAVRACYAALRMQDVVRRYSDELRRAQGVEVQIRVGVNSGEVVVRSIGSDLRMDYTAVGQTTHLAARMEQLAAPGSIRLIAETLQLAEGFVQVTPLGPVPIKGLGEPVEVFELVGAGAARTRFEAAARRGLTRFVGRNAELEQLRGALDRASQGHGQVVAVVGEPGVGKSRLFWELTHAHLDVADSRPRVEPAMQEDERPGARPEAREAERGGEDRTPAIIGKGRRRRRVQFRPASRRRSAAASSSVTHRSKTMPHGQATVTR